MFGFFLLASSGLVLLAPERLPILVYLLLLVYFGVVTVIDSEHRAILHPVSLAGALICGAVGFYLHGIWLTLLGGAVGFGAMFVLYTLGVIYARQRARRQGQESGDDALGFGDVNLSGVIGLLLGWPGIVAGLVFAVLAGGAASLVFLLVMLVRRQYRPDAAIPYGPFLAITAMLLLLFRAGL